MSGLFGLDAEGNDALREEAALNPILPEQVQPGFTSGLVKAIGKFPFQAAGIAAKGVELAGAVPTGIVGALLAPQTDVPQKYFETFDPYVKGWNDYFAPNPRETGTAARVLGGFGQSAALLAAGGGNPALLIASTGLSGAMDLADQGVSPDVAAAGGALESASTALGFKVPFLGKSLPMRLASGAVGFPALNAATVEAQKQLLLATGYSNLAAAYQPLNGTDRAADFLVGGLFGALHHFGAGGMPITAEVRDAALALANARHLAIDATPGFPADVATTAIHQQTIEQAMGQLLRDEPVTPPATLAEASFEPKPPTMQPADVPKDLQQLDAARAPEVPPVPLASPIPAGDEHVARLAPEQQPVLHDIYARAAEAKPAFDSDIGKIAAEVGGKADPVPLKGTKRAVEKVLGEYGGVASRIRDVLRTTIEVKTLADAHRAVTLLQSHPGLEVLNTGARDLLAPDAPSLNGYRDAKFSVRTANGSIAEVQVNLKPMLEAKAIGHSLYSEFDTIARKAREQNRPLTEAEASRRDDLGSLMEALYEPVWKRLMSDAKASGETGPPLRSTESIGNRRGGPSNAMESRPPSEVGTNATGTPSTSNSREPLGSEAGSSAGTGADTGKPPTGQIVPESGAPKAASAHNIAPGSGKVEPAVQTAAQLVAQRPDLRVATGNLNPDGTAETVSAAEAMARTQQEITDAEANAKAFGAAVDCATQKGVE
jgi:hypothetical protein